QERTRSAEEWKILWQKLRRFGRSARAECRQRGTARPVASRGPSIHIRSKASASGYTAFRSATACSEDQNARRHWPGGALRRHGKSESRRAMRDGTPPRECLHRTLHGGLGGSSL